MGDAVEPTYHGAESVESTLTFFINRTHDADGFFLFFCPCHCLDHLPCLFFDFFSPGRCQAFKTMTQISSFHVGVMEKKGFAAVVTAPIADESVFPGALVPGGIRFLIHKNQTGK